jgi:hypothetical protein
LVQQTRAALLGLGSIISELISIVSRTVVQMRAGPRVAKAPQNSVRKLKQSLHPRVPLVQRAGMAVVILGLIVFRTAVQMLVVVALGMGLCFVPDVNAHVPQTREFSATAASWVEYAAKSWGRGLFGSQAEAVQPQPSVMRSAQFVATQAVLVTSAPGGAIVRLGGRTVGKTPISLRVAPGTYTITFSLPGYAQVTRTITVKVGKVASVGVTLTTARVVPVQPTLVPSPRQTPDTNGPDNDRSPEPKFSSD